MRYTPQEEFRLSGQLTGENAEQALDALTRAEIKTKMAAEVSMSFWAPSAGDHAEELGDLVNLTTYYDLPPEVKGRIEGAVSRIRKGVFVRYAGYRDWLAERA